MLEKSVLKLLNNHVCEIYGLDTFIRQYSNTYRWPETWIISLKSSKPSLQFVGFVYPHVLIKYSKYSKLTVFSSFSIRLFFA